MKTRCHYLILGLLFFGEHAQSQRLDCDSTCLVPQNTSIDHINIAITSKNAGQFSWGPTCGASANSVLPNSPIAFLCGDGSTPGSVATSVSNGETLYTWTCTSRGGTSRTCTAEKREVGACGSSNGQTLSSNPSNLCSSGSATGMALLGSAYKWYCQGNYGSQASCSATYYKPPPPEPTCQKAFGGPLPPCPYFTPPPALCVSYGYNMQWFDGTCGYKP